MLVVVDPKILFHYYIITSSLSATVMALTYNPDLVTQTVYDPFKSRYQVTTISYLGFSLFFAIPSVSLDEDNYYTVADFSAYTNYLVSFYSKYRTQLNSIYSANGKTNVDALLGIKTVVSYLALNSDQFTFDPTTKPRAANSGGTGTEGTTSAANTGQPQSNPKGSAGDLSRPYLALVMVFGGILLLMFM